MRHTLAARLYRRLATPISRQLVVTLDRRRASRLLAELEARRPRCYVIVMAGCAGGALRVAGQVEDAGFEPVLVLNAVRRRDAAALARDESRRPTLRLRALPLAPAKHGTVLTMLLLAEPRPFAIIDHDCAVFEPAVLRDLTVGADEFGLALHHSHFFTVNRRTGLRFPRTHFLLLNAPRVRRLMADYGVTAEKRRRLPAAAAARVERIDIGPHNYPREYLTFYDTLLALMALAHADGVAIRWRAADQSQIVHLPHLGLSA